MSKRHGEARTTVEAHRRRRERELASLYATARALTALGEVDSVLEAIVRHAHDLIGPDLTYLSVIEGDVLQVRASAGLVSPRFRNAQLATDAGLGGLVISSRAPFWVRNYLADTRFRHSAEFDEIIEDEALVALLGVPLLGNGQVSGVLFAAFRVERHYGPDEVSLLSAFADHAAVALENARLYEQSRQALAELQRAYASIERSAQVHEALTRVVLTGGGEAEIASLLVDALHGRVTVVGRQDRVVATRSWSGAAEPGSGVVPSDPRPDAWSDALPESRSTGRSAVRLDDDGTWHTVAASTTGSTYLGAVVWSHRTAPGDVDRRTVERASQILGLLALTQDAVVQAEERLRGDVLAELLRSTPPLGSELIARGRAMRLDLGGFNALLVVASTGDRAREVRRHLDALAGDWAALVGEHLGRPTMALRTHDLPAAVRLVHRALRATLKRPTLVCGAPVDGHPGGFGRAFAMAGRCAQVLAHAGVDDVGTTTTENGMYAVLFDPERAEELQVFLDATLGPLDRHDERHKTALLSTVGAYFANGGNVAATARSLHVHGNTLLKRLDRVAAVLGPTWNSPDRALTLHLAVRLRTLRSAADA